MTGYSTFKKMQKRAWAETASAVISGLGSGLFKITDALLSKSLLLAIAASAGTGTLAGWLVAKATAHDNRDVENARKAYTNARLSADLGYLKEKTKSEYNLFKERAKQSDPKSARILNG